MEWTKNTPEALASIPMDEQESASSFTKRSATFLVIPVARGQRYAPTLGYVYEFHGKREWAVPTHSGHGWDVAYYLPIPPTPEG